MRLLTSIVVAIIALSPAASFAQVASANPTLADCSIASLSGSSQSLGTAYTLSSQAANRKYLLVCNTSSANNLGVNFTGGTAALSGAGTITLVPGACKEFSNSPSSGLPLPPTNSVKVIGTAGQPALCYEGR